MEGTAIGVNSEHTYDPIRDGAQPCLTHTPTASTTANGGHDSLQ
jgi:hypothetical protein